ncbi:cell division protein FtsA [Spiroplasma litorale]|uniref:Cell division protein FtsA n=1 Tax=Spiroplasma litorale TaxID=216942 RepID=A0A0K1W0Q6_9MOLU|nr:hypothetical protein [Spiroplasma litorale]AKX33905.1 cell division protein FtsA [Spiroplasma litorale]
MYKEVYGVIEITQNEIKFAVGVFRDNRGLKVIFKERIKGNWLTEDDEIIDVNRVSQRLKKLINSYNISFRDKIKRVSVIFPSKTLQIKDSTSNVFLNHPENIVRHEHINNLYRDANRINFDDRNVVINIKPYLFYLNNQIQTGVVPLNATNVSSITMMAKIYTVSKKVHNSFVELLKNLEVEKLIFSTDVYSIARQINSEISFKENFVTINWGWNTVDIGYFCKEALVKKESINSGIKNIIDSLSKRINSKFEVANKYIFKLLDFSTNNNSDSTIYRKYVNSEKRLSELTAEQIKNAVLEEINWIIDKADSCIEKEFKESKNFKIHHVGKMTEIAGFEKILQRSKFKSISSVYYSLVTGASEIWLTSICGMIKLSRINNKNSSEILTSNDCIKKQNHMGIKYPSPSLNPNYHDYNQLNRGTLDPRALNQAQRSIVNRNINNMNTRPFNNGVHMQKNLQNNLNFQQNNNNLVQNNHSWQNYNHYQNDSSFKNNNGQIGNGFLENEQKNR